MCSGAEIVLGIPKPKSIRNAITPKVPALPPPPKPVTADDPAIIAARKSALAALTARKGRRSTILTGGAGVLASTPLSRPQALGA